GSLGHHVARNSPEDRGLRHAVAAEAVGSMDAARVLAGREEPLDRGPAGGVDHHATHHEVGRRAHLDGPAREVAAEVTAALDHAAEVLLDHLGAEVGDVDPDAAVRRAAALRDLEERGTRHEVARRAPPVVAQQLDGAALLEPRDVRPRLGLLGQAVHDLDAGEVALVDRAVVALAGERLLVDPALARPVEEAAVAPFELERASWR